MIKDNVILVWAGLVLWVAVYLYSLVAMEGRIPAIQCEYIDLDTQSE